MLNLRKHFWFTMSLRRKAYSQFTRLPGSLWCPVKWWFQQILLIKCITLPISGYQSGFFHSHSSQKPSELLNKVIMVAGIEILHGGSNHELGVVWAFTINLGMPSSTMEVVYTRWGFSRPWRHKLHKVAQMPFGPHSCSITFTFAIFSWKVLCG